MCSSDLAPLGVALGLLLAAALWRWWPIEPATPQVHLRVADAASLPRTAPAPMVAPPSSPQPAEAAPVIAAAQPVPPTIWRQRAPGDDQTPDLADYVNEGERPTTAEAIDRLRSQGVTGGLAAFQPPGTRPPLIGLAVPEDYPLPPGYVRHHQVTDDGQRIEAVLMYSPDQPPLDAQGRPVEVPANRVVPDDAAPPGLARRHIRVPPPRTP